MASGAGRSAKWWAPVEGRDQERTADSGLVHRHDRCRKHRPCGAACGDACLHRRGARSPVLSGMATGSAGRDRKVGSSLHTGPLRQVLRVPPSWPVGARQGERAGALAIVRGRSRVGFAARRRVVAEIPVVSHQPRVARHQPPDAQSAAKLLDSEDAVTYLFWIVGAAAILPIAAVAAELTARWWIHYRHAYYVFPPG